jgi:hypothetical protein
MTYKDVEIVIQYVSAVKINHHQVGARYTKRNIKGKSTLFTARRIMTISFLTTE